MDAVWICGSQRLVKGTASVYVGIDKWPNFIADLQLLNLYMVFDVCLLLFYFLGT